VPPVTPNASVNPVPPQHIGIIMDGNGRWAAAKGLPRLEGHRRGAERLIEIIDACIDSGIGTLTVFAFSAENWKRPLEEVSSLDRALLRMYREERGIIDYPYDAFSRHGTLHVEKGFSKEGDCWYMTTRFTNAALYPICAFQKDGARTSPGKACWARACQVSKERGASHLYVYEGYGLANQYKANSEGFEWWDGSRWSGDKGLYLEATRDDHRPHPKIPAGIDS